MPGGSAGRLPVVLVALARATEVRRAETSPGSWSWCSSAYLAPLPDAARTQLDASRTPLDYRRTSAGASRDSSSCC
ncbi:hypothetical protein [Streptomyces sp. NPDC093808]|uniref:hypothetical protein n=1 Tax=Streptomyces sp. NPDC093808 TaxID=3154985 RepID=UPI00344BAD92